MTFSQTTKFPTSAFFFTCETGRKRTGTQVASISLSHFSKPPPFFFKEMLTEQSLLNVLQINYKKK